MNIEQSPDVVSIGCRGPIWERFFLNAPIALIGTSEPDGQWDFAPKHMISPMGWDNYFGFVCTPSHGTYRNIQNTGIFTVTFPRPSQLLYASLAASPRCGEDEKPVLRSFDTIAASAVEGQFVADGYVFLECEKYKVVDGFGVNSLVTGRIVHAHVHKDALREYEKDEQDMLRDAPLLAYIHPGRFATISTTHQFPMPEGMKK